MREEAEDFHGFYRLKLTGLERMLKSPYVEAKPGGDVSVHRRVRIDQPVLPVLDCVSELGIIRDDPKQARHPRPLPYKGGSRFLNNLDLLEGGFVFRKENTKATRRGGRGPCSGRSPSINTAGTPLLQGAQLFFKGLSLLPLLQQLAN